MTRKSVQQERRNQILEALGKCLIRKSFPETSIKEIAREAKVNHGVLHYYFKSKEDILMHFIDFVLENYKMKASEWISSNNLASMDREDLIREIFRYKLHTFATDKSLSVLFNEAMSIAHRNQEIKDKLRDVFEQWINVVADILLSTGIEKKISLEISREIICIFEGIKIFSDTLNYSEKQIREILGAFEQQIISRIVCSQKAQT